MDDEMAYNVHVETKTFRTMAEGSADEEDNAPSGMSGAEKDNLTSGAEKDTAGSGAEKHNLTSGAEKDTAGSGAEKDTAASGAEKDTAASGVHVDNKLDSLESSLMDIDMPQQLNVDVNAVAAVTAHSVSVLANVSTTCSVQGNASINNETSDDKVNETSDKVNEIYDDKMNETSDDKVNETSDDKVNESSDDKVNETFNDKVNETSDDKINETSDVKVNETFNDKVNESSDDKVNGTFNDKVNESSDDKVNGTSNDKVNETSDDKINETSNNKVNDASFVLDDKTGQLVVPESAPVTEDKEEDEIVIIDDEADPETAEKAAKDRKEYLDTNNTANSQTVNPINKMDQVLIVNKSSEEMTHDKDKVSQMATITIPDDVATVTTDVKGHMVLHVPIEKQQQLLGNRQVISDLVPFQQQQQQQSASSNVTVSRTTVQQAMKRSSAQQQSEATQVMGPKKLTVWAQSLVDIGFDIVKTNVLQDFITLQDKKLHAGELPDAAKVQLEKFKKNHEELSDITQHLDLRMNNKCTFCHFRTESNSVLHWHKQHPHTNPRGQVSCSFCPFTTRNAAVFKYHMQTDHVGQAFFEREIQKYECPLCHFEGSSKIKFVKHRTICERVFQLFTNLSPTSSHVTYCLHDGMFMKPPAPAAVKKTLLPYTVTQPVQLTNRPPVYSIASAAAGVSNTTTFKLINPPNVSMASMQHHFSIRPTVRQVPPLLNRPSQIGLPQIQQASNSFNSVFTRQPISQQHQPAGTSPIMLSQLTANPNMMARFVSGPNTPQPQYSIQIQQQLAQLQQLQEQNAQAMKMLKRQKAANIPQQAQVRTIQPILYNQVQTVFNRVTPPGRVTGPGHVTAQAIVNRIITAPPGRVTAPATVNRIITAPHLLSRSSTGVQADVNRAIVPPPPVNNTNVRQTAAANQNNKAAAAPVAPSNSLITCEVCQGFVKDRNALRVHLFYAHQVKIPDKIFNANDPPFRCCLCQSRFWSGQGLIEHKPKCKSFVVAPPIVAAPVTTPTQQNKHSDTYTCIICYRPVTMLLNHMKSMHDLALTDFMLARKCVACGLVFNNNELLNTHMSALHGFTVKRPDKSQLVLTKNAEPATSVLKRGATMDVQTLQKQTTSTQPAGKSVKPAGTLSPQRHKHKAGGEPLSILPDSTKFVSYKCVICSISFDSNASLTRHCLTFHSNCKYCGMIFANVEMMHNHKCMKDPRYIKCVICQSLMKPKSYRRHIERKHLKKCCVPLKRLSEQQIEQYTKKKKVPTATLR